MRVMALIICLQSFYLYFQTPTGTQFEVAQNLNPIFQNISAPIVLKNRVSLECFSTIFNNSSKYFPSIGNVFDGSKVDNESLIKLLTPWIIAHSINRFEVVLDPAVISNKSYDCMNSKYGAIMLGNRTDSPRIIIDFVPFGYDVEKLELRLYELFDVVDVFVIYESLLTQSGLRKPLFFSLVKDSSRFLRWKNKVSFPPGSGQF